jgi:hypothetical protein
MFIHAEDDVSGMLKKQTELLIKLLEAMKHNSFDVKLSSKIMKLGDFVDQWDEKFSEWMQKQDKLLDQNKVQNEKYDQIVRQNEEMMKQNSEIMRQNIYIIQQLNFLVKRISDGNMK